MDEPISLSTYGTVLFLNCPRIYYLGGGSGHLSTMSHFANCLHVDCKPNHEPMSGSIQLSYSAYVTAFLQIDLPFIT